MNEALLSSKNLNWCTPPEFFDELDQEFHFNLDPAATDKCAKCAKYFTPETDGLKADWGGSRVFCNPPYGRNIGEWVKKGYEEARSPAPSWLCSYRPERTPHTTTIIFLAGRLTKCASCGGGSILPTKKAIQKEGHPSPLPSLSGAAKTWHRASGTWCWISLRASQ